MPSDAVPRPAYRDGGVFTVPVSARLRPLQGPRKGGPDRTRPDRQVLAQPGNAWECCMPHASLCDELPVPRIAARAARLRIAADCGRLRVCSKASPTLRGRIQAPCARHGEKQRETHRDSQRVQRDSESRERAGSRLAAAAASESLRLSSSPLVSSVLSRALFSLWLLRAGVVGFRGWSDPSSSSAQLFGKRGPFVRRSRIPDPFPFRSQLSGDLPSAAAASGSPYCPYCT